MKTWTTKVLLILAAWLVGGSVQTGMAADWSVTPSIDLRSEFNSNLNYNFGTKLSDYIFTIRPGLDFKYATEISQLQAILRPTGLLYITHSNLDTIDQNYQINGRYQVLPRLNFTLNSAYIVDSTLIQELTTSGLFMNRTPRESIAVNPALAYALTERLLASVGYSFYQVSYQDPAFRNYTSQGVNSGLDYLLSNEKTTLRGTVSVNETRYPGGDYYRSLGTYGGLVHNFSESWYVLMLAGANFTEQSFKFATLDTNGFPFFVQVRQRRKTESSVQPYVQISTTKTWTQGSITGGYSRSQSGSAYGGLYETNRLYLTTRYNFTEKLSGGLNGYFSTSDNSSPRSKSASTFFSVSPQLTYRITEKLGLTPGYSFGFREDRINHQTTDQHVVWLALNYSYPIHAQY